ncbi:8-oxo-dGTP diphosphatase [Desulfobaculum xiamenense]|uniref:8-oxo-dGTP diphosphatase n=1 Tax=Desulfobaculum xiamenense TaxID=995050 RepID=A0A846QJ52_9BACT|nr:NUDIX hydrolase [Desulfobaculum xiamenense]NJB67100.1 8-oxo-dGTP diphosphatase [Desulfobaculum xiamenense]
MLKIASCPHCGGVIEEYCNPVPTVDVVIHEPGLGIVLVERKNPPSGWALPGGFVDCGETVEQAAVREAYEETGLHVELTGLLGVYSDPARDPRMHTLSVVFTGRTADPDALCAGDDAGAASFFPLESLPTPLAFDHARIIEDFRARLVGRR